MIEPSLVNYVFRQPPSRGQKPRTAFLDTVPGQSSQLGPPLRPLGFNTDEIYDSITTALPPASNRTEGDGADDEWMPDYQLINDQYGPNIRCKRGHYLESMGNAAVGTLLQSPERRRMEEQEEFTRRGVIREGFTEQEEFTEHGIHKIMDTYVDYGPD